MRLPLPLLAAVLGLTAAFPAAGQSRDADAPVIIFFAWDRPVIDGDAATRLDALAAAARQTPGVKLVIAGHADRSGPAAANIRSARARAHAVQAYLRARGIPDTAMQSVSHGESRPLIPTADGVREPQNRRVEITAARDGGV